MPTPANRPQPFARLATATLVVALCLSGCAVFASKRGQEPTELPATIAAHHDAIEVERARLKDLVSQPTNAPGQESIATEVVIAIARRLSRLQASLEELEAEARAQDEAPHPSKAKSKHPAP